MILFVLFFNKYIIEVYGESGCGSGDKNTDIIIPVNPLNKIAKYIYHIKQNII